RDPGRRGHRGDRGAGVPDPALAAADGGDGRVPTGMTVLVEAEGAGFSYGPRTILDEIALAIHGGALVAVCGPNGAGKSTLLRLLLGLHAPSAGKVRLGGASVATLSRREIARRAALLPQDAPVDLPLTVREAVALGR